MTFSTVPDLGDAGNTFARLRAKFGPLSAVIALHVVMGYLIYSGTLTRMVDIALPQVVNVTFVAPPTTKAAPPEVIKTVPVAQVPPPVVVPPVPVVQIAVQNAITVPQVVPVVVEKTAPAAPAVVAVAAPPAPPSAGPRTLTSGVEYIQAPQPVYPAMSKRMGEQGKVVLRVLVNEKGMADQVLVQTSSGSARLDEAGRQAALRALFKPHVEDGRAVAVYVIVPLNFQLAS